MKHLTVFLTFLVLLFNGGCGVVGLMGTPTRSEKIVPAEYNLFENRNRKILVLVEQPAWLNAQVNLQYHLTEALNKHLVNKVKIKSGSLTDYRRLSEFRSNTDNYPFLSPSQIGKALSADIVLFVVVEDHRLSRMAETDYYKGHLYAKAVLFDTASGEKLWPEPEQSRTVKVGFEVEQAGRDVAVARLANSLAYCTTRYFYNCPLPKFKILEDRSGAGWDQWDK